MSVDLLPCRRLPALFVAFAALVLAAVTFTSDARAGIYFANNGTNSLGRANVDGSGVNSSLVAGTSNPLQLAVSGQHVYWSNGQGTIGRANLDGTGADANFVTGANWTAGVAVQAGHLYWTNKNAGTIGRANLDGTAVDQSYISGLDNPFGLEADGEHLYWTNNGFTGRVGRANLDGTGVDANFIATGALPYDVEVDAGHVYWSNTLEKKIGRASLDGTGVDQNFIVGDGSSTLVGISVDDDHIYWSNGWIDTIGRARIDGSAVTRDFIAGVSRPIGTALTSPPDTTIDSGPAAGAAVNSATPTFGFSSEPGSSFECSLVASGAAPAFGACSGPGSTHTPAPLADGDYTFSVRAMNGDGDVDATPATRDLTVDTTAPGFIAIDFPSSPTDDSTPDYGGRASSGAGDDDFVTLEIHEGSSAAGGIVRTYTAAINPLNENGYFKTEEAELADGTYTLVVTQGDAAGNTASESLTFIVDTVVTPLSIDSGPTGATNDPRPTFGFTAEAGATVRCSVDQGSAAFGPCSAAGSHRPASGLADGNWNFRVEATDAAGNSETRTRSFTVDTTAPPSPAPPADPPPSDDPRPAGDEPAPSAGTRGDDVLEGTAFADVFDGLAGADVIRGAGGDDDLRGGDGPDVIEGGDGDDVIRGSRGPDRLDGGGGRDMVYGGRARDQITADDGERDRISCGRNVDTVVADELDRVAKNCENVE